jgi:hypothetical protein
MTIWRFVACCFSKATRAQAHTRARALTTTYTDRPDARARTHTDTRKYVIPSVFPQQQWFRERASLLRYTAQWSVPVFYLCCSAICGYKQVTATGKVSGLSLVTFPLPFED